MRARSAAYRIMNILDDIGAAFAATSAVRNRRQPDARDLQRLGIDPEQFARIGR